MLLVVGGSLVGAGGALHPRGSGTTVEAHLLSMFADPAWARSHLVGLAGLVACVGALALARRVDAFGPGLRRVLAVAVAGWALAAAEQVPHLLSAGEAHALGHDHPTPVLDLHVVLQVAATPAAGLSLAALAVAVARSLRTWESRVLVLPAVVGGIGYAAAAPMVATTWDPAWSVLFPFQAGLALWFVGTGTAMLARRPRPGHTASV